MTDKIDDGGPAFPTEPNTQPGFYLHHGMSLRDYYAGCALPAAMAWYPHDTGAAVAVAYRVANYMLAERKASS